MKHIAIKGLFVALFAFAAFFGVTKTADAFFGLGVNFQFGNYDAYNYGYQNPVYGNYGYDNYNFGNQYNQYNNYGYVPTNCFNQGYPCNGYYGNNQPYYNTGCNCNNMSSYYGSMTSGMYNTGYYNDYLPYRTSGTYMNNNMYSQQFYGNNYGYYSGV